LTKNANTTVENDSLTDMCTDTSFAHFRCLGSWFDESKSPEWRDPDTYDTYFFAHCERAMMICDWLFTKAYRVRNSSSSTPSARGVDLKRCLGN
jgi:hypothetical protein